ncbi:MAG: ETC complex I subunit [Alphaproteobacteria bacterium]|nr:ETC complex I subunit [Alphaproteobacteria bacterium]
MAKVKIYQPAKTAMQSGMAKTHSWLLEFVPQKPYFVDNLMGWVGMSDTQTEANLRFATKDDAVAYATREGLDFEVTPIILRLKNALGS